MASTGTISTAGLGSGLDISGIVSKLMSIERAPINKLDSKTAVIETEITAYGTLKGILSSFQSSVQALTSKTTYNATKATIADSTLVNVSSDSTAAVGSYSIQVDKLAKQQKLQSTTFSKATDTVGSGTLTFDFGTYETTGGVTDFKLNTNKKSVTVTIPAGSDSLTSIASAINAAKAGVSATVLNDGTNSYLSFSPTDPGVANSLRITADDADGVDYDAAGLSRLAFDMTSGTSKGSLDYTAPTAITISAASTNNKFKLALDGGSAIDVTLADGTYDATTITAALQSAVDTAVGAGKAVVSLDASNKLIVKSTSTSGYSAVTLSEASGNNGLSSIFGTSVTTKDAINRMTQTVAPQDAKVWVDGVLVTKSTNTITDAIQGVTLSLQKESATATTLTVAADSTTLSNSVKGLVDAYNSASKTLADLLAYDPKTGKSGALQGEGTVRAIQATLRQTLQTVTRGAGIQSLSEIGVSFQRDGTLAFNSSKLETVLSDPTKNVRKFFMGPNETDGLASKLDSVLSSMIGASGTLVSRTEGLNQTLSRYEKQRTALENRMESIEARYTAQYNRLDSLIASLNQTSTYLTQQLANLPNSNKDK